MEIVLRWALCLDFSLYARLLLVSRGTSALVKEIVSKHPALDYVDADLWKPIVPTDCWHREGRLSTRIRLHKYKTRLDHSSWGCLECIIFEQPQTLYLEINSQSFQINPVNNVVWLSMLPVCAVGIGVNLHTASLAQVTVVYHDVYWKHSPPLLLNLHGVEIEIPGQGQRIEWLSKFNQLRKING